MLAKGTPPFGRLGQGSAECNRSHVIAFGNAMLSEHSRNSKNTILYVVLIMLGSSGWLHACAHDEIVPVTNS